MKVHVLEAGLRKKHPFKQLREALFAPYWFPVSNAGRELKELRVDVSFHNAPNEKFWDCDLAIVTSRTVDYLATHTQHKYFKSRREFCDWASHQGPRLFWFDTRDSAGNGQFDVLPYVSRYLKRSVYRDRATYLRPLFRGRAYSDYYHSNYALARTEELNETDYDPAATVSSVEQLDKLYAAWGCGAEFHWPMLNKGALSKYMFDRIFAVSKPSYVSPLAQRQTDVCSLFDEKRYSVESVGYQRLLALKATRNLHNMRVIAGRVPRQEFYATLAKAKIAVSVFGWGEVCFREYEATYCGAAIAMADMSSIETYPDFYIPDKYYTPFKWDFSDFEEKLSALLSDDGRRLAMAEDAQSFLRAQWTSEGRRKFASRFFDLVQ